MRKHLVSTQKVGWANRVADNYELIPLGRLVRLRNEKNDPVRETQGLSLTADRGVILYEEKGAVGNQASEDISRYSIVKPGDIVINSMNVIIGSVGLSKYNGVLSPVYYVLTPISPERIDMRYLAYHFQIKSFQRGLIRIGYGILDHRMRIPWINLAAELIVVPPIEEQCRIADYLDIQLQSVRMMISKKEALVAAMSKERLTKITSLVTSGSCDGKENFGSDIDDWINFKSKEWNLLPLKYLVSLDNSGVWGEDPGVLELDVPVATTAHLTRSNTFLLEQMPIRSLALNDFRKYVCKSGDLIVVKSSGSSDNIMSGKVCVVGEDAPKFAFSNFLMRLRPHDVRFSRFLQAFLSSHIGVERVKRMVSVTTYPNLRVEEYMNSLIPVPPENVIRKLTETIETIEKQYSAIIEKIEQSLENLRQYENSLITEYVTGASFIVAKGESID